MSGSIRLANAILKLLKSGKILHPDDLEYALKIFTIHEKYKKCATIKKAIDSNNFDSHEFNLIGEILRFDCLEELKENKLSKSFWSMVRSMQHLQDVRNQIKEFKELDKTFGRTKELRKTIKDWSDKNSK